MKTIKIVLVLFFVTYCCISCKETVNETLQILIQNRTDSLIYVTLYPKETAPTVSYLYPRCEGCGGYHNTEFTLSPHDDRLYYDGNEVIFHTNDLDIKPYTLASKAFDSIYISSANKDNVIVKLTPENVTGYSENIFSENSSWDFKIVEDNLYTQFRKNPQKYHCYSFLILDDKMIIE